MIRIWRKDLPIMMINNEIAIDLGTANILVYNKDKGLVYNEPSFVAIDKKSKKIIAIGHEAKAMLGRTNKDIETFRPMIDGVISDYKYVLPMVKRILKRNKFPFNARKVTISVPYGVSDIEMRSVVEMAEELGFHKIEIVDEPVVAALGEGIDINEAKGNLIVDIGAGTTDIAVITLGSIAIGKSIKIASDDYDAAIIGLIRNQYNLEIGQLTAEKVKMSFCRYYGDKELSTISVAGLNVVTGLPDSKVIKIEALTTKLTPVVEMIVDAVHSVLEATDPELVSDILANGLILTGGGSFNPLVKQMIADRTGLEVITSLAPLDSVGNGLMRKLNGYTIRQKPSVHNY